MVVCLVVVEVDGPTKQTSCLLPSCRYNKKVVLLVRLLVWLIDWVLANFIGCYLCSEFVCEGDQEGAFDGSSS